MKTQKHKQTLPSRRGPSLDLAGHRYNVEFETAIVDAQTGKVERILQRGRNVITDFGMDGLASNEIDDLITTLHLGSTTGTLKRIGGGVTQLTIDYATNGPSQLLITTNANFFEAGDVGRTLKIAGFPEMVVDVFTNATTIEASARDNRWLPNFNPATPGTGPHTDFGIHYVNTSTLAAQFTKYGTFDTGSADYNSELNDSANSRWNHQRIWLSSVVGGVAWTVNQLGWSDNNVGNNCFGIANLGSPDTVPVGKQYRVKLNVYSAYQPVNITGFSANWGPTVGTHSLDIKQERILKDGVDGSFLQPFIRSIGGNAMRYVYETGVITLQPVLWEGDPGFGGSRGAGTSFSIGDQADLNKSYTSGNHNRERRVQFISGTAMTSATCMYFGRANDFTKAILSIKSATPITKPSDHWIDLTFLIFWTRELTN